MTHATRSFFAALAGVAALFVAGAAEAQPACDCSHLSVLQAELRNAQRLRAAFLAHMTTLRGMGGETARAELQRFAGNEARRGLEAVPGAASQSEVDYVPYGEGVDPDRFGPNTPERNAQLCAMRESSAAELNRAIAGVACAGIGEALRAHERHHVAMCGRIGYRSYLGMHGADRAQEEAEAYGAQIAVLRRAIATALESATVRIESEMTVTFGFPPNPMYRSIAVTDRGNVRAGRAAMDGDTIRLDGDGELVTDGTIQGNCRFVEAMPARQPIRGTIETDGLTVQLSLATERRRRGLGMVCSVPGAARGISAQAPAPGNLPEDISLSLRDGAEEDLASAYAIAARMTAGSGVQMTGEGKLRLRIECPMR